MNAFVAICVVGSFGLIGCVLLLIGIIFHLRRSRYAKWFYMAAVMSLCISGVTWWYHRGPVALVWGDLKDEAKLRASEEALKKKQEAFFGAGGTFDLPKDGSALAKFRKTEADWSLEEDPLTLAPKGLKAAALLAREKSVAKIEADNIRLRESLAEAVKENAALRLKTAAGGTSLDVTPIRKLTNQAARNGNDRYVRAQIGPDGKNFSIVLLGKYAKAGTEPLLKKARAKAKEEIKEVLNILLLARDGEVLDAAVVQYKDASDKSREIDVLGLDLPEDKGGIYTKESTRDWAEDMADILRLRADSLASGLPALPLPVRVRAAHKYPIPTLVIKD